MYISGHSQAIRLFDLPPAGQAENCNLHFHLMGENKGLFKNTQQKQSNVVYEPRLLVYFLMKMESDGAAEIL